MQSSYQVIDLGFVTFGTPLLSLEITSAWKMVLFTIDY